ncbi:hypothetical protein BKA93DRAFT_764065 [Sparassis latifolia]
MSDPPKKLPGSLRDRIAAFENKGSTPAAAPPPIPRPKPAGGVSWKPRPRSPPSSPPQSDAAVAHEKPVGTMSAADAKESIGKGGSLKDRMAALQGLSAFGGGAPSPPPKPTSEKPKWKPPPVVHKVPAEGDDEEEEPPKAHAETSAEEHAEPVGGEEHASEATAEGEEAQAGPDPVEEERQRRAAIAARMARLGGARVGMSPPVFGRKPEVKKVETHKDEEEKPAEHAAATSPEDAAASHPTELTEAAVAQQSNTDASADYSDGKDTGGKDSASLLSTDSASSGVRSSPMPVPAGPRRAVPPRKRVAKSPAPPAPVLDEVIHESPSPIPGTTPEIASAESSEGTSVEVKDLEPHGNRQPEITHSQVALVEAEIAKAEEKHEAPVETPKVHQAIEEVPQPIAESTAKVYHPEPVEVEERLEVAEAEVPEVAAATEEAPVQAAAEESAEETEEDVVARRKRITERLAKSGGVTPLGGASPLAAPPIVTAQRHESLSRKSTDSDVVSPRSPIRRASTDSTKSHIHPASRVVAEPPTVSESLGRKGSVGSVHSNVEPEAPVKRLSQDDQRTVLAEHILSEEPREEDVEHAYGGDVESTREAAHELHLEDVEEDDEGEEAESDYHETESEQIAYDKHTISAAAENDERHVAPSHDDIVDDHRQESPAAVLHDESPVRPPHIARALPPPPTAPVVESLVPAPAPPPVLSPRVPTKRLSVPPPPRVPPPPPREASTEEFEPVLSPPPPVRSSSLHRLSVPPPPRIPPPPPLITELAEGEEESLPPRRRASLPPAHPERTRFIGTETPASDSDEFVDTEHHRISTYSQPESTSIYEDDEQEREAQELEPEYEVATGPYEISEPDEIEEEEDVTPPPPPRRVSLPPPPPVSHHQEVESVEEVVLPPPPVPPQRKPSIASRASLSPVRRMSAEAPPSPSSVKMPTRPPPAAQEKEILHESDVDPIDPAFYRPQKPIPAVSDTIRPDTVSEAATSGVQRQPPSQPMQAPRLPAPATDKEQTPTEKPEPEEESEQMRRHTIAERMAQLGGIRFGAPPPPPVRPLQPMRPTSEEVDHPGESAASGEQLELEQPPEEEDEFARKQRIAARIAGMGGMRFGMLPTPMAPPAPQSARPAQEDVEEVRAPPPPHRTLPVPPPPPPATREDEEELESVSTTDEGEHIEPEESEAEEVTYADVEEEVPPVPFRGGRHPSTQEVQRAPPVPQVTRPPVPQVTRPPVPSVPSPAAASSPRTSRAIPAQSPASFGYPPAPAPPPPSTRPSVPIHESHSDYVMVDEAETVDNYPHVLPPRTASMKVRLPARSVPPPPPLQPHPMESGDSQWEMPNVPQVDFGAETDLSLSAQWSEDSTSYPPPPSAKTNASRPSSQIPSGHAGSSHVEQQLTADDLVAQWGRVGVQIHEVASVSFEKSKKALIGDGSYVGFVTAVLSEVPNAVQPVPPYDSFGYLIYAQTGSAVQRRASDLLPGDIIVVHDAKFKGHKGLQTYHQNVGVGQPLIAIIGDYEVKKAKVKVFQANQHVGQQSVESASYRLEDLKSGSVKVYRVLEK